MTTHVEGEPMTEQSVMHLCGTCGNKRCPHASAHWLDCTGSNESGQVGSYYGIDPPTPARADEIKAAS